MNANPLLSVIVPVYNVETYLCQCVDSLLAQDLDDYEIILVDDGSTDTSGDICDRYAAAHAHVHCLHQPNAGLPAARQSGMRASRGRYVTFVDSDDWIAPDMYAKMCGAIRDTGADVVICSHTAVTADSEIVCRNDFPPGYYNKERLEHEVYPRMLYSGTYFRYGIAPNLWNKIFRRELLLNHLFHVPTDVIVGEDALASYSCLLDASSIYFLDESLYYYRSNADSLSRRAVPLGRLQENRKLFDTLCRVIDTEKYPCMAGQLAYYCVYQSLLAYELIFRDMARGPEGFRRRFLDECRCDTIRSAFRTVPISDIGGLHNKLYAFCVRHRLYALFRFLLRH